MNEPKTMSRLQFNELCENELTACDEMLQRLHDDYNSSERVSRRDRIAKSSKPASSDELVRRINLFKRIGYEQSSFALEVELLKRGENDS